MINKIKISIEKMREVILKIVNFIVFTFSFVFSVSRNKGDRNSTLNPLAVGNKDQRSTVRIDISHLESTEYANVIEFYFKPSQSFTLSKVNVAVLSFTDEIKGDSLTVYNKDNWHMLVGYQGVEVGQQWSFTFYGKELTNNKDFKITLKYVVSC